ncbi:MAG TPA: hypothetical protein VFJ85_02990 [Acidimicrobiales bacterium]|nr:hypothetical protein [Acidimicrobiales bacterium]
MARQRAQTRDRLDAEARHARVRAALRLLPAGERLKEMAAADRRALARLIEAHRDELDRLRAEERLACPSVPGLA